MFKITKTRLALLTATFVLPVASCGAGEADDGVVVPTSSPTTSQGVDTTTTTDIETTTSTTSRATTTTGQTGPVDIHVSVEAGSVEGGGRILVGLDSDVSLIVAADVADEVHVHGYDIFFDVTPEIPGTAEFVVDIPGIFEVEMEDSGLVLLELVVQP